MFSLLHFFLQNSRALRFVESGHFQYLGRIHPIVLPATHHGDALDRNLEHRHIRIHSRAYLVENHFIPGVPSAELHAQTQLGQPLPTCVCYNARSFLLELETMLD